MLSKAQKSSKVFGVLHANKAWTVSANGDKIQIYIDENKCLKLETIVGYCDIFLQQILYIDVSYQKENI